MSKSFKLAILALSISLTACSNMSFFNSSSPNKVQPKTAPTKPNGAFVTTTGEDVPVTAVEGSGRLGGAVASSMDVIDKSKLSHALDKPLGKSTTWTNSNSGIKYTVTPTEKVAINGNSLCRRYSISSAKNDKTRDGGGTACVSTDGNWHSVSG